MDKQQFIFKVGMRLDGTNLGGDLLTIVLPKAVAQMLMWRIALLNQGARNGYQRDVFQEFSIVGEMDMLDNKYIFSAGVQQETKEVGTNLLRIIMPKSDLWAFGERIRLKNDGFKTHKNDELPDFHFFGGFLQYADNQAAPTPEHGKEIDLFEVLASPNLAVDLDQLIDKPSRH